MTAGEAIILLNHGHKITRSTWNKGGRVFKAIQEVGGQPPANYFRYEDNGSATMGRHGNEWIPTHADLTAEDWAVLPT